MKTIELAFTYTKSEYVKAERQYLFVIKTITKTSIIILALYLLFSIPYAFLSLFSIFSVIVLIIALIASLIGCIAYFYMPIYHYNIISKKNTLSYSPRIISGLEHKTLIPS